MVLEKRTRYRQRNMCPSTGMRSLSVSSMMRPVSVRTYHHVPPTIARIAGT